MIGSRIVFLLSLISASAFGAETVVFVTEGDPLAVTGGALEVMKQGGDALVIPGPAVSGNEWSHMLFADLALKKGDFHIHARLTLDQVDGTGASFVFGGHYHYSRCPPSGVKALRIELDGADGRVQAGYVESLHYPTHKRHFLDWEDVQKETIGGTSDLITPGEPFTIDWIQKGEDFTFHINEVEVLQAGLEDRVKGVSDGGWPANFGFLAPGEATIRLHEFRAEGNFARPALDHADVFVMGHKGYNTFRIPGLCVTPKGTLLAFSDGRGGQGGILCRRSTDNGASWSEANRLEAAITTDPSPLVDWETGDLFLVGRGQNRPGPIQAFIVESEDDGLTWSPRRPLGVIRDDMRLLTPGPAHGIQITQGEFRGRLVVPVYFTATDGKQSCAVACSDDHGETWTLGGETPDKTYEPHVAELKDGSLLLTCRDHARGPEGRGRGVAISRDGGATWEGYQKRGDLPAYGVQATLSRYRMPGATDPDEWGPLILSAPAEGRRKMTIMLSYDEGKTWPVSKLVYPGHSAYSAMRVLPDGRIALLYERDHYRRMSFVTFDMGWLTEEE